MQPKKVDLVGIKMGPDSTDKIMTTTDNPARITGRPVTEIEMTLPVDRGEGQGTAGNKIADGGWDDNGDHVGDFWNWDDDIEPDGFSPLTGISRKDATN